MSQSCVQVIDLTIESDGESPVRPKSCDECDTQSPVRSKVVMNFVNLLSGLKGVEDVLFAFNRPSLAL